MKKMKRPAVAINAQLHTEHGKRTPTVEDHGSELVGVCLTRKVMRGT